MALAWYVDGRVLPLSECDLLVVLYRNGLGVVCVCTWYVMEMVWAWYVYVHGM